MPGSLLSELPLSWQLRAVVSPTRPLGRSLWAIAWQSLPALTSPGRSWVMSTNPDEPLPPKSGCVVVPASVVGGAVVGGSVVTTVVGRAMVVGGGFGPGPDPLDSATATTTMITTRTTPPAMNHG